MTQLRFIRLILCLLLFASVAHATTTYYAQSSAGSANGADCADALALPGSLAVSAGNIYIYCGTGTYSAGTSGAVSLTGGGASGNPAIFRFAHSAVMQAPYWGANGAIHVTASNITIDGSPTGTPCGYIAGVDVACDGTIQATANGAALANHVAGGHGVQINGSLTNVTVQNVNFQNLFVPVLGGNANNESTGSFPGNTMCVYVDFTSNHITIQNNVCNNSHSMVRIGYQGTTGNTFIMQNNVFSNTAEGIWIGAGGASSSIDSGGTISTINNNDFSNLDFDTVPFTTANGSCAAGSNHQEFIHLFTQQNSSQVGTAGAPFQISNNYFHGLAGCSFTSFSYIECDSAGLCGAPNHLFVDFFNNVIVSEDANSTLANNNGGNGMSECEGSTCRIYNNTYYSNVGNGSSSNYAQHCEAGSVVTLQNNIFDGMNAGFVPSSCGTTTANTNLGFGLASSCGAVCSVTTNPLLSTTSTPKYQLSSSGSGAHNAGANLTSVGISALDVDQLGVARPSSAAWDMGAFQFASGGGTVSTPTFSPVAGTYTGTQSVSINTATGGATLCYTTDGSTPTANGAGTCTHGTTYTTAVSVAVSETLQAVGSLSGDTDSAVGSAAYVIQIATPTFSPVAGTYSGTQSVSITSSTAGVSICYTIDGTTPTATTPGTCSHGTTLANGGTISVATSETVKALGTKTGTTNSSVASAAYVILSFASSPAIIPAHHAGNITLTLTGVATSWTGSTAFSVSCGTLIGKSNISATSETLTVTTSSVCTMTITDTTDSVSSTISVAAATISVVPASTNISTTPTLTITGVNTLWTSETPAGLFTVTGGTGSSIGTPTINSDTSATVVLTAGSAIATETITDTSTTATATVSILGEVLTIIVTGTGSITSSPSGINCPGACSAAFPPKTLITLTPSGSLNNFSQGCAGVSCIFNIVSNTSVTALFGCGGSSPACFKNSSDSVIVQNLVAGCNSLIVAALCGSATTTYSISGNVVSISVPNSFGPYALVGISGCSAATQLNGLHFVTNGNTTGSVVSGNVYNSQGTLITPANVGSTAETKCYLQGQGWQPWVLAPFPAPGTTGCVNGNGQPSCAPPSIAVPSVGTWALDWSTPQAGAGPNNAPAVCWVQVTDQSFAGNGNTFGTTASGESNDPIISFNDGSGGYFYTMVFGGTSRQVHGHIDPNYCGTGVAGFVADVTAIAGSYTTGNLGGYGSFSRNPNEGPGVNQANWYFISVPTFADNFHPKLEYVTLTYAAGAVTANAPTVIADISVSCSGFQYTQIGNGLNDQVSQFKVDNRPAGSHRISFGLGTGNQGTITRNTTFEYDQATGVCVTRDFAGYAGTNVNSVHVSAQTGAGGYSTSDTLGVSQSGCTATFQPTTLGTSNVLKTVTIVSGGTGCSNALGVAVTGGSGTGGTVDITGIGTQGAKGTIWPYQATSPLTSPWDSFGMHSGNCDLSLAYCDVSGADTTPDGANCTTVHGGFPGYTGGCTTVSWAWQDTNPSHMLMQYTGHGQIGCKYQGYADSGIIDRGLGPDLNGTRFGIFAWGSIDPATAFTSPHGSWPDPNCNQSLPVLLTMGPNVPAQETNPPNYGAAYGEGYLGVMKDSTSAVNDTRWFTRYYSNVDPLCGSNNVFGIWEMSPDGVFVIAPSNMNGVPTGSASTYPYSGNTGMGVDNNGQCFTGMFSVMLNAQSFGSQIVQAPVNPILLANKGGK